MNFLLDTCVVIWVFEGSPKIGTVLRDQLTDPRNDLFFSDVSILEIVIKHQLGKLPLEAPPSRTLLPLARKHLMEVLPLTTAAIMQLERLPMHHRDPFDRLLIGQAVTHQLTLVTPDPLIQRYEQATVCWNP